MNEAPITRGPGGALNCGSAALRRRLLQFELQLLGSLGLAILANHF